jgi:DNA-binding MarR family transcriptional regulator
MEHRNRIGLAVRILSNQIGREFERQISSNLPAGITGLQGRMIGFIRDKTDDVFQKDIEKEYDIRRSTATGMLQLMEKNGLLTREAVSFDARLKKIVLTDKALGIHDQIIREIDRIESQLMNDLTEDEINTFFSVAKKISNNIK